MPIRSRTAAAVAALGAATALLLAGCGSGTAPAAPQAPGSAPIPVVTTTNVYGAIVSAVGGDRVQVTSLVNDPAADPHTFEATPADAAKVADARIVVMNGGGYDDFATKLTESAGGDRSVIDVVALSGLQAPGATEFNEHVWYNPPTIEALAVKLAADLSAVDPTNAAAYQAGAKAVTDKVAVLNQKIGAIKEKHPGTRVAVTEPVPGYLVDAAGLVNDTPEEFSEAIEEDTDPPAVLLQATLDLFTGATPVRVLILNTQTQTPVTDQVRQAAQTAGVPVVDVSETLPAGQTDYFTWMGGQIDALAAALNR